MWVYNYRGVTVKNIIENIKNYNPQLILELYDNSNKLKKSLDKINSKLLKEDEELILLYKNLEELIKLLPIDGIQISFTDMDNIKTDKDYKKLNEDLTYLRPRGYRIYRGKMVEVNSFRELYIDLINFLYRKDSRLLLSIVNKSEFNGKNKPYFGKNYKDMTNPYKIDYNYYIETHFNANQFRDILLKLFRLYNIDLNYLKIYIEKDYREKNNYYK